MTSSQVGADFDWARYGLIAPVARPSIPGGPQPVPQSVQHVLEPMLAADPDDEGLVGPSGRFTWSELDATVEAAARALTGLGVERYDRVAVSLPNDVDIVVVFLAVMRLGAIWVGLNRQLVPPERDHVLADSGARVLLAESAVVAGTGPSACETVLDLERWREMVGTQVPGAREPRPDCDPHAPAAIAYTSGTTGRPKGAVHSQHNLMVYGAAAREAGLHGTGPMHAGVQLPLTILNLFVIQVLHAWQNGGKCVCLQVRTPIELAEVISRERIAHFASVPTIYHDLLGEPSVPPDALASLRLAEIGGTNVPVELLTAFADRFGIEPRVSYGMTEAPAAVTRVRPGEAPVAGLVGVPLPHLAVSIHDGSGLELPAGQEGEIRLGPVGDGPLAGLYTPTLGYWNRPEESAAAIADGRYRSGDLGVLDGDGRLFIRGRLTELIIRGGANVHPAEVERVLGTHHGVRAAAVLGLPDDRLGQRVVAVIEPTAPGAVTADELAEHCVTRLARYKVPARFEFVDRLPRNTMQKVLKAELATLFQSVELFESQE